MSSLTSLIGGGGGASEDTAYTHLTSQPCIGEVQNGDPIAYTNTGKVISSVNPSAAPTLVNHRGRYGDTWWQIGGDVVLSNGVAFVGTGGLVSAIYLYTRDPATNAVRTITRYYHSSYNHDWVNNPAESIRIKEISNTGGVCKVLITQGYQRSTNSTRYMVVHMLDIAADGTSNNTTTGDYTGYCTEVYTGLASAAFTDAMTYTTIETCHNKAIAVISCRYDSLNTRLFAIDISGSTFGAEASTGANYLASVSPYTTAVHKVNDSGLFLHQGTGNTTNYWQYQQLVVSATPTITKSTVVRGNALDSGLHNRSFFYYPVTDLFYVNGTNRAFQLVQDTSFTEVATQAFTMPIGGDSAAFSQLTSSTFWFSGTISSYVTNYNILDMSGTPFVNTYRVPTGIETTYSYTDNYISYNEVGGFMSVAKCETPTASQTKNQSIVGYPVIDTYTSCTNIIGYATSDASGGTVNCKIVSGSANDSGNAVSVNGSFYELTTSFENSGLGFIQDKLSPAVKRIYETSVGANTALYTRVDPPLNPATSVVLSQGGSGGGYVTVNNDGAYIYTYASTGGYARGYVVEYAN